MGWNDMTNFMLAHQQAQNEEAAAKKAAAEAAQAQYLQGMLAQYGFDPNDPLSVKEGLWDKLTPWQTDAEKARPYANQLLNNSALALDKEWYDQNVTPNQKTAPLKAAEWLGSEAANNLPSANWPQSYDTSQMNFQSRNPYQDLSREDLMAKGQQDYSGLGNPETAQPAARGTQPISGVLDKKTNTEKFLEYLKQSAGAKL